MEQLVQELGNGLATGAYIGLLSIGYALIFGTTHEFHFAHGSVFMVAAWILVITTTGGWIFPLALMAAVMVAFLLGISIEKVFYSALRQRADSDVAVILTSLALFILIENVVVMMGGSQIRFPTNPLPGIVQFGPLILTRIQLVGIVALPMLLVGTMVLLRQTRLGRSIRAVGSDPELAYTVGVDAGRIRLAVFALGSGLAALAAAVLSIDAGFTPPMGLQAILLATIAVTAGGLGSVIGAASAGVVLGMAQHVAFLGIGTEWQNPIAFGVLMVVVILRPSGFGRAK